MLWHAVNLLAFVSSLLFIIDACVIPSKPRRHIPLTQSVSMKNSRPQPSPEFSMRWSSNEAISTTSTNRVVETTPPIPLMKSKIEIMSSRLPGLVTPTSTMVTPSLTFSTYQSNCTDEAVREKKLREKIELLKGKTAAEVIEHFEGNKRKVYNDKRKSGGKKTVGIGFNMEQSDARKIWKNVLPNVPFDDVLLGKRALTDPEIQKLFQHMMKINIKTAKRLFPKYDTYPDDVKTALLNGVFRGDFNKAHKTVKFINTGQWEKVAKEYLNREDFRNCIRDKLLGIWYRLMWNAHIFRKYASKIEKEKLKKKQ